MEYDWGPGCEDALSLGFDKKRADERKAWLQAYDPADVLDYGERHVSFHDLVHKDLIHFSQYDVERSIPSAIDGFKPSQRKIMCTALVKIPSMTKKEMRVSTLASETTSRLLYHHGENFSGVPV